MLYLMSITVSLPITGMFKFMCETEADRRELPSVLHVSIRHVEIFTTIVVLFYFVFIYLTDHVRVVKMGSTGSEKWSGNKTEVFVLYSI